MKPLKTEVAALKRKIQLELVPPKPEAAQKQQESGRCEEQPKVAEQSAATDSDDFIRSHVLVVRPEISGETKTPSVGMKM